MYQEEQKAQIEAIARSLCQPELRDRLQRDGYLYQENVVPSEWCDKMINDFKAANHVQVNRVFDWVTIKIATLNGQELSQAVPLTAEIYEGMESAVSYLKQRSYSRLNRLNIGLSMNLMLPGDIFSRHFDRQRFSLIVYLNQVKEGDLLLWPFLGLNLSRSLRYRFSDKLSCRLSDWIDPICISPKKGAIVMFTDRCLHGVQKTVENQSRFTLVLGYDRAECKQRFDKDMDYYGEQPS